MKKITLLIIFLFTISSCLSPRRNTRTDNTGNPLGYTPFPGYTPPAWTPATPPASPTSAAGTPTVPSGPGDCIDIPGTDTTGNATGRFFETRIIALGKGYSGSDSDPSWSSTQLPIEQQMQLDTDSKFKVRIIALPAPPRNTAIGCNFRDPYSLLSVDVGLRHPNSSPGIPNNYSSRKTFTRIGLNQCPLGKLMAIPFNLQSGQYPVIDIMNVQWDRCDGGLLDPSCPNQMSPFGNQSCFEIYIQVATDHTTDFP